MFAELRQSIADWIFRASVPEAPPVTLVQRRIFILPTRQGYVFALTLLVMLLASINYQLSLGFILTFLLASMAGVAMLHTWRNLAHLKLRPGRCDPVFAGETAHFGVTIETPSQTRFAIAVRRRDEEAVYADVVAGETTPIALPVHTRRRGLTRCGRLEVFTRYPIGLFHAWSYVDFHLAVMRRCSPRNSAPPPRASSGSIGTMRAPRTSRRGSRCWPTGCCRPSASARATGYACRGPRSRRRAERRTARAASRRSRSSRSPPRERGAVVSPP